jgi:hypothetical protein
MITRKKSALLKAHPGKDLLDPLAAKGPDVFPQLCFFHRFHL